MFEIGPFQYKFKNSSKKIYCDQKMIIKENHLVLIAGPSGSGKSSFLQVLKGIIPKFSSGLLTGDILYKSKSLDENFNQNLKRILFLFQNPFTQLIYPDVAEEFFFSMENFKFSREEMDLKREELKSSFNLDHFWHKKTAELSHGECQRLVLASLLAIGPEVLLLDEPTAFMDPGARSDFYGWLKKIKGSQTIIVVDHHIDEILPLADQVLFVSRSGQITEGFPERNNEKSLEFFSLVQSDALNLSEEKVQLKLSNISFRYQDQKQLLENISLSASSGDIVVIKGKNGKGKSTLFKIMAGLIKPLTGNVRIFKNNKELEAKNNFKEIGFIFQNPESHFFYDTIEEELKKISSHKNFELLLRNFLTGVDLSRSPFLLSEGEKRRLSILMTVLLDKTILLYDEPTFGQDQESISIIRESIHEFKKRGKIQIIISHDEEFIKSIKANVFHLEGHHLQRIE